ncbi:sucrase-isomaltase, intestinal [Pangasianodon hypophthalmus]|uniref:sucrase-isomaltase, intestinal n=1 Tax=Pangasianodon hypophthalmus TaxID=310915 RepID=UPI0023072ACA|nr:sucrase-isomaltase, intestinal [Pangasianodon hypophthalmus]
MGKKKFSGLEITLMVLFLMIMVVAIVLIALIAVRTDETTTTPFVAQCPDIALAERVDCFPDAGASQQSCQDRGCCWSPHDQTNVPWCFFSSNHGYTVVSENQPSSTKLEARLKRQDAPSLFGSDILELSFVAEMQTENRLRFKITDANNARFEVPQEHVQSLSSSPNGPLKYEFELLKSPFGVRVRRASNKKVLFDTSMGPLVFANQYLQLSAKLSSDNIYGLGEHVHKQFRHDLDWKTWPIFTRDSFPNGGTHNLYGHYPFFMCLEDESGKSFGVFLMNSNAMEVTFQPAPAVTYRTIGGVLDFYILIGDTPEAIVQEFTELVGRPTIPPYWAFGFQLSRWDYGSLEEVKNTVERNRAIDLPYDVQYTDIDYMEDKKDFTYDLVKFKDLPQFADYMHAKGQRYILILDPAIATSKRINGPYESHDRGTQADAWVTEADGKTPLVGEVWPGETVFPDYTKQSCIKWWVDEIVRFHNQVNHDAIWIDMNEVSSFVPGSNKGCADNTLNYPPFTPNILDNLMYSKTLCMDAKQAWGNHYDVHSLYGYSMVLATEEAVRQVFGSNRSFILTRSSFPGVGKYSGHWLGDNAANWNDIKWAIPGMLEFNLFGVPYIGADICGFFDDTTEELCTRWMQVGAFYPFSRNHNAQYYKPQDPAAFGANSVLVRSSKHYLNIRYTLLPYLYTLFYRAHVSGDTVVRPVMHEFYSDPATWTVDRQFLWGAHLLITPVLDAGAVTVQAYIPDAVWYNYETEEKIKERKQSVELSLPLDKMGLHIRGGAILPIQRTAVTTVYSRRSPMGLIIALDDNNQASGELFWDDGESRDTVSSGAYILYQFSVVQGVLTMQALHSGYSDPNNLVFENVTVLGLSIPPTAVTINDGNVVSALPESSINYDSVKKVLYLKNLQLQLGKNYTLTWNSVVEDLQRFNCHPEEMATENSCTERGCIWAPSNLNGVPWCYFPMDYGYISDPAEEMPSGWSFNIRRNEKYPAPRALSKDINTLKVEITYLSGHSLRFKIFDPANKRYEVPVPLDLPSTPELQEDKRLYTVNITQQPFGIQVIRKSTGTVIWNSSLPGFIFSDLFIQISTLLPSQYIYGFGESERLSFRHNMNWHTWGMFSKDQPPGYKLNSYGVHPFYMGLEPSAHAHGVLLLNSNAMDVTVQPTPALTYRTIGGILDFYMVMGPTPELVVQEYTAMIGRPVLPAYWSLGFQLCRYGYVNDTEIEELYADMLSANIPYDVQYADIDYMERQLDFVLNKNFVNLPKLVEKMRGEGMRFIFILDPAISGNETNYPAFERGVQNDVFIKWPADLDDGIVWGKVWPDYPNVIVDTSLDWETQVELYRAYAAFPDFFRNTTAAWWQTEINDFYTTMRFDGLWIDMNEPASFVDGTVGGKCLGPEIYENPPYMPPLESKQKGLNHKTLCMNSQQFLADGTPVKHYDVHNLYGWSHTKPTYDALLKVTGKRGIVVTRSTYPSSGRWAGHWLGDNTAAWDQLFKSVIGMMEFSLFGISYTGADICGFFNHAEYEMCLRWMQLGAFYPYSRNHNGKGSRRQDPVAWDDAFANASRDVLNIRYTLLPYLYTLMFEANTKGSTVVRPMLHEFVDDKETWDIYKQFLWGPALLISPALDQGATEVNGYIPNARWYNYHTAEQLNVRGKFLTMPTPLDHINLHVRGGFILPWQKPENNTRYSRKNPLGLIVALNDDGTASGSLFWDDGEGIGTYEKNEYLLTHFNVLKNTLSCLVMHNGLASADQLILGQVKVWGAGDLPITKVTIKTTGTETPLTTFSHNQNTQELIIDVTNNSHVIGQQFSITWSTGI